MKALRTTIFEFATGPGGATLFDERHRHILMNSQAVLVDPNVPVDVYGSSESLLANAIERAPGSEPTTADIIEQLVTWAKQQLGPVTGLSPNAMAMQAYLDYRCKSGAADYKVE